MSSCHLLHHHHFPYSHHHHHHHLSIPPISSIHLTESSVQIRAPFRAPHIHPITTTPRNTIKCMANPRRVAMVAKQIRRELSDMLLTDTTLQYAILPEAALGADRYLSSVTTISDVEVTADLQVVKVYVSIFGDERGQEVALAGLKANAKYVRGQLGKRMKLRLTPEVRFIADESFERGSRVIAILDKIKNEKKQKDTEFPDEEEESTDSLSDDDNWDEDGTDGDVIYVR